MQQAACRATPKRRRTQQAAQGVLGVRGQPSLANVLNAKWGRCAQVVGLRSAQFGDAIGAGASGNKEPISMKSGPKRVIAGGLGAICINSCARNLKYARIVDGSQCRLVDDKRGD